MRRAIWSAAALLGAASVVLPNPIPGEMAAFGLFWLGGWAGGEA